MEESSALFRSSLFVRFSILVSPRVIRRACHVVNAPKASRIPIELRFLILRFRFAASTSKQSYIPVHKIASVIIAARRHDFGGGLDSALSSSYD